MGRSVDIQGLSANYAVTPSGLRDVLIRLISVRQPVMVWGPPGVGKSQVSAAVAKELKAEYIDIRALLLDPVDLRGIPAVQEGRTVWMPPSFLPETKSKKAHLINLEELPAAPHMVQAALYQLVLDRACGEYRLPEGAAIIACGNRISDRGVSHKMPTPLASRFVHVEVGVEVDAWIEWATAAGIAPEVIFFIQMRPELLHQFDPQSQETAFPCPRTWEFVSRIVEGGRDGIANPELDRTIFRGTVGEAAAVEFSAFLKVWRELPHPQTILDDPDNAEVPENTSTLIALCGSLYRIVDETTMGALIEYSERLRPEIGEFLVRSAIKKDATLQYTEAYVTWRATH